MGVRRKPDDILIRIAGELGGLRRESLTEQLVQKLKSLIVRGIIVPGEYLPPERELAAMLRVSRPSLRGALKALQIMGVLEVRQGSRTYLTEAAKEILSAPSDLLVPEQGLTQAEIFEARRAIEAEAAATAAERATHADLECIRREFEAMRASAVDRNVSLYGQHDMAFHEAIADASGNKFFIWFVVSVNKVLFEELWSGPLQIDINRSLEGHEKILRTIEANNRAAARAEMLNHLALSAYTSYFTERGTRSGSNPPRADSRTFNLTTPFELFLK